MNKEYLIIDRKEHEDKIFVEAERTLNKKALDVLDKCFDELLKDEPIDTELLTATALLVQSYDLARNVISES